MQSALFKNKIKRIIIKKSLGQTLNFCLTYKGFKASDKQNLCD